MLLKQYIKTIKQAKIKSEEIKEFVEFIKNSNFNQLLNSAKTIFAEKDYKSINERVLNIAKTIIVLHHVDQTETLYPYSERDLDKLGFSIYKKFYK